MKSKTQEDVTKKDENTINFTNHFPTAYSQANNLKIIVMKKDNFIWFFAFFISKENRYNLGETRGRCQSSTFS